MFIGFILTRVIIEVFVRRDVKEIIFKTTIRASP